jgi:CubicO group peptidase (beta-lactamase class C family)
VANAPPAFHFTAAPSTLGATTIQYQSDGEAKSATLDDIMAANGTHAVIVVKDDRIVYEQYFNGYRRNSIVTSFSVAKSVTSLLVGAAIDARKIKSIDDPVTAYLPELLNIDPRYAKLSLSMLLDMRSGIEFADHDLPWGDKPRAYYDPRLRDVVLSRRLAAEPGSAFQYNTYNPILLGIVLERATGMSVATWFERALWSRLGMEFGATWSIDSEIGGMEKMESGINARAIDFAKLGRLMLNRGGWNGEQVISSAWIVASMTPSEANRIPEFGQHAYYRRAWWVTAAHAGRPHAVAATGHLGQFIYIYPERNVIIVRFGAHMGGVDRWSEVFDGIVRALEVP